ncbi:MAG: SLC13 family permease [Candidatus Dormibacter sp.]
MRLRTTFLVVGAVAAMAAAVPAPAALGDAAVHTWSPFVLVTGLLLIGVVANEDGLFIRAAGLLARLPGGSVPLYVAAMLLVASVTVLLNLDTSVAFLTPVLVHLARRRGAGELRFLYGCVFMSNAASLLLPGSNLTNLLILSTEHSSGSTFLSRMAAPWLAAVAVTIVVVAFAFRTGQSAAVTADPEAPRPQFLSVLGIGAAAVLILVVTDSALPVLGVGAALVAVRLRQGHIVVTRLRDQVDFFTLAGIFMVAVSLGAVARVWSFPGQLMATAGSVETAAIGAVASVLVNNLPAAVLLGSRMPLHARSLLFGLNIGPNLAVTGSLSALLWWQAARSVGARPSAMRYSAVGMVLAPLTIAAALAAARLP